MFNEILRHPKFTERRYKIRSPHDS
jgi:hypothetical protein